MNRLTPSRSLRLEQLESRCMLAGGIFSRPLEHNGGQKHDALDHADLVDLRPSAVDQTIHGRPDIGRGHVLGRDQGDERSEYRFPGDQNQTGPRSSGQVSAQPPSPSPTIVLQLQIVSPPSDVPQQSLEEGSPQSELGRSEIAPSAQSASATAKVNAPKLAIVNATHTVSEPERHVTATNATEAAVPRSAADAATASDQTSRITATNTRASSSTGGIVEMMPLLGRTRQSSTDTTTEEPWEVDPESLHRLREVMREPLSSAETDATKNTDAAIAAWFNRPTGLMEIEAFGKLENPVELTDSIPDVVLNATVGLHRRVDLIAAANADRSTPPGGVRDAILAAIAAEPLPRLPDPLFESSTTRLSAIAYPGAAIIAAGITIASRRRRSGAKMESTGVPHS